MSSDRARYEIRYGLLNYLSSSDDLHTYDVVPVAFLVFYPPSSAFQRLATEAAAGEDACCVCLVNRPNAQFTLCGHAQVCCVCADTLVRDETPRCPLCRARIAGFDVMQ